MHSLHSRVSFRLALIAHDSKKADIVALARQHREFLQQCCLCATNTTGCLLIKEVGLAIEFVRSGPMGGDLQIGAKLVEGGLDAVIFFRDPWVVQPHEADINALARACDVHNIPLATNPAAALLMLQALQGRHTAFDAVVAEEVAEERRFEPAITQMPTGGALGH